MGFRSVLSLVLADGDPFGAVTLYSRRPSFFSTESLAPELGFAQQASIAIIVAVEREQLVRARDSRGIVGQAQGILMERYHITADQAFAVLRRYSSPLNQKLRLIAERIVSDRSLPDLDLIGLPHDLARPATGAGRRPARAIHPPWCRDESWKLTAATLGWPPSTSSSGNGSSKSRYRTLRLVDQSSSGT